MQVVYGGDGGGRHPRLRRLPSNRWITNPWQYCAIEPAEEKRMIDAYIKKITRGVKPAGKQEDPVAIFTLGSPGSGKSTTGPIYAKTKYKGRRFVLLSGDDILKHHPQYRDIQNLPDTEGQQTGIGFGTKIACLEDISDGAWDTIYERLIKKRYNIIFDGAKGFPVYEQLKEREYRTVLLFVGVPVAVAVKRAAKRAVDTGKYLADTRKLQQESIRIQWRDNIDAAPWFAQVVDEFVAANNVRQKPVFREAAFWGGLDTIPLQLAPKGRSLLEVRLLEARKLIRWATRPLKK